MASDLGTPELALNHIGISVPNLDEAVEWYKEHLGIKELRDQRHFRRDSSIPRSEDKHIFQVYGEPFGEAKVAYLVAGNDVGVEIFEFVDPKGHPPQRFGPHMYLPPGCYHVAFTHPDPVAYVDRLVEAGGTKIGSPAHMATGDVVAYVQDPFGLVLEFCTRSFSTFVPGT